ncbi:hypothetical protein AB3662_05535 [Sorangium cellulosum]|uniref:hypothetical protein n=1 Tax=Sorangium cellulosum TaxID=56 RepID=UPI003D9AA0D5
MKTVMQSATTSGDGAKIAPALEYVAPKPSPGMPMAAFVGNRRDSVRLLEPEARRSISG